MASPHWTEEKEEVLCAMWEERPFLYDPNVKGYNNRVQKDQAYREIAYAVGIPVGNVMKRMVSLRTQYSRVKNKTIRDDKPISRKGRWMLEHVRFLAPFIDTRNASTYPNVGNYESEDQMVDPEMQYESEAMSPRVQYKKKEVLPLKRKAELEEIESEDFTDDFQSYQETSIKPFDPLPPNRSPSPPLPKITEVHQKKDQEQMFCDFLAGELREIKDPMTKAKLINKIQNEVFTCKMEEMERANREGLNSVQAAPVNQPVPVRLNETVNCTNSSILDTPGSSLMNSNDSDSYKLSPSSSHNAF